MDSHLWDKIHGAVTHFPIALSLARRSPWVAGCMFRGSSRASNFQSRQFTLWIGALAACRRWLGLVMTHGRVLDTT
jgi:hypothetical protein